MAIGEEVSEICFELGHIPLAASQYQLGHFPAEQEWGGVPTFNFTHSALGVAGGMSYIYTQF